MSLCSVGIMGASYVRDASLPETIEVHQGETVTIDVPYVYDEFAPGREPLKINLRQSRSSSQLRFVSFQETSEQVTKVLIDSRGVPAGDYELRFESIDSESSIQTALKTDTILISLLTDKLSPNLVNIVIPADQPSSWSVWFEKDVNQVVSIVAPNGLAERISYEDP